MVRISRGKINNNKMLFILELYTREIMNKLFHQPDRHQAVDNEKLKTVFIRLLKLLWLDGLEIHER